MKNGWIEGRKEGRKMNEARQERMVGGRRRKDGRKEDEGKEERGRRLR